MTEVELKAALTATQAVEMPRRLEILGFAPSASLGETDRYCNGADRDFRKSDEALRLRTCRDLRRGGETTLLTYKGPKRDARSNTRTEWETAVADADAALGILEALGFAPQYTVDKTRHQFTRESVTVCLDTVTNLGTFMELELLLPEGAHHETAVDQLLALLEALGVGREALLRTSYLEMLIGQGL